MKCVVCGMGGYGEGLPGTRGNTGLRGGGKPLAYGLRKGGKVREHFTLAHQLPSDRACMPVYSAPGPGTCDLGSANSDS